MTRVSKAAKLSYSICKGSMQDRKNLADKMLSEFIAKTKSEMTDGTTTIGRVKENIIRILPQKRIRLDIEIHQDADCLGYLTTHCKNGTVTNYTMGIRTNPDGKIGKNELSTVVHEAWHFFEFICNPKMNTRLGSIEKLDKAEEVFDKFIYAETPNISEKSLKKIIKKKLNKKSERIDILQYWRNKLQSEQNAQLAELKYINGYVFGHTHYSKKLQMLNNLLKKELEKSRANHSVWKRTYACLQECVHFGLQGDIS